jgi:hypothetical protein
LRNGAAWILENAEDQTFVARSPQKPRHSIAELRVCKCRFEREHGFLCEAVK